MIVLTTPACKSYSGILANRFFLGLVESGISPILMLVVGLWYTHEEQQLRSSWWYSFSGGSLLISPLVNFGLAHIAGGGLAPWQYMFLVAGAVTLAWGVSLIWIFPDTPQEAKGWTPEEKRLLLERSRRDNSGIENTRLKGYQVREALLDYQLWCLAAIGLLSNTGAAALTTFASIMFSGMGFSPRVSLLLNIPLGAMAFLSVLGAGYLGTTRLGRLRTSALACLPVILGCSLV